MLWVSLVRWLLGLGLMFLSGRRVRFQVMEEEGCLRGLREQKIISEI